VIGEVSLVQKCSGIAARTVIVVGSDPSWMGKSRCGSEDRNRRCERSGTLL
jgi:hypothetical protein